MGYDLHGAWYFRGVCWPTVLDVAYHHGWIPQGTLEPALYDSDGNLQVVYDEPWCGTYFSNDYQLVTDQDAKAIGDALALAQSMVVAKTLVLGSTPGTGVWLDLLGQYTAFCRAGGFLIG